MNPKFSSDELLSATRMLAIVALAAALLGSAYAEETLTTGSLKSWTIEKTAGEASSAVSTSPPKDSAKDAAVRFHLTKKGQDEPKAFLVSPEIKTAPLTKLTLSFNARRDHGDGECAVQVIEPDMRGKVGRRDGQEEQERMAGHVNIVIAIPAGTKEWKPFSLEFTVPKDTGPFRIYLAAAGEGDVDLADVKLAVTGKDEVKKPNF